MGVMNRMDFEILKTIAMIAIIIGASITIVLGIVDIVKSNKYWKSMNAELELFRGTLKREHMLLKAVQEYGEWLRFYHKTMFTNLELEHTDFNDGVLSAAEDCIQMFMDTFNEYVGEFENDIDSGTRN